RTPPIDELASTAEKAIPEFDHRLVTAVQLNRPTARTQGMSKVLIAEVTREAGEMVSRHNLLKLIDYRRLGFASALLAPVLLGWAVFALVNSELMGVLLKRQALMDVEIPRTIHLQNATQDVWPIGEAVEVRFKVTGEYSDSMVGRLRVAPDGQMEDYYDLKYEKDAEDGGAYFVAKLPASSIDFNFTARLGNGRSREVARVRFEPPPQLADELQPDKTRIPPLTAEQVLPTYLGTRSGTDGVPYVRRNEGWQRGEIVGALPMSSIIVDGRFNKPVAKALLIPLEREGLRERELPAVMPDEPDESQKDRKSATWQFPTTPRMIGYRIELVDDRGFKNPAPIRRGIRMLEDRPPVVAFMPESTRHPNPNDFEGGEKAKIACEWGDKMPLPEGGRIMVIFNAKSEQGISRVNIVYRVIAKGIPPDAYPEDFQKIQHPKDDPNERVFKRLELKRVTADLTRVGQFVPDLGLFEQSWFGLDGVKRNERAKVNIEFYPFPSPDPKTEPGELEAGGRYMFEIDALLKKLPDGTTTRLEVGDAIELFVEAIDKNPTRELPGYTREARRKIVVNSDDYRAALRMRDEQNQRLQRKVQDLLADQKRVFLDPPKIFGEVVSTGADAIITRLRILEELKKEKK
ncbi:MAG: hypothetical protein L0241_31065, partial [Planctomycetia bacterium]|nr:hypothetical protein [Planctomycetia bacterium]